jgi:hypothetical protein
MLITLAISGVLVDRIKLATPSNISARERLNKGLAHGAMELEISSASDKVGNCAPAWSAFGCRCGVLAQCGHFTPVGSAIDGGAP